MINLESLSLIPENSESLYIPSNPVDFKNLNLDLEQLIQKMKLIMKENRGIGLSAPQIGLNLRIFIMDMPDQEKYFVNPEILEVSEEKIETKEGCLSFPGLWLSVARPQKIKIRYYDLSGNENIEEFEDLWARCVLHEYEHLEGITFTKKVSKLKLDMANKKRNKILKRS